MKKKVIGYRLKVIGLNLFMSFLQINCFVQGADSGQATVSLKIEAQAQESNPYFWDFGPIREGEIAEHIFTIKNDSLTAIQITGINTSCGCTASKVQKEELSPGDKTEIEVKFNSKGYSGQIEQFVYVNTNNPDNPVIKLTIKAQVIK
ncbi:MAG: DUF1573 domain-containing protein [Candidatus Omnitrophica bacterium]|nr:DUF1573 domain-containing protein [Candidatus Omnitrophota bacterium]